MLIKKHVLTIILTITTPYIYAACPSSVAVGSPDSPVEIASSLNDDPAFAKMHLKNVNQMLPLARQSCQQGVTNNCRLAGFLAKAKSGLECYAGVAPSDNEGSTQSQVFSGNAKTMTANSGSTQSNKVWWGLNTNCARYTQLETKLNAQWFSFTNGCNTPIYVVYKTNGGFSRMTLAPGQTDKSWFLVGSGDIKFAACNERGPAGESVHFDEKANNCYYFRR